MDSKNHFTYYELSEHSKAQVIIFWILLIGVSVLVFSFVFMPGIQHIVQNFLDGDVVVSGELPINIENVKKLKEAHLLSSWAIDVFVDTSQHARYWFNPILALTIPSLLIALAVSIVISAILPVSVGYINQKIDREIVSFVEKIGYLKYGFHSDEDRTDISNEILHASLRELYDLSNTWNIPIEDLKILQRGLKWREASTFYKFFNIFDGLTLYMRFYFTIKYANTILGFVYMGAAVLIIIIGLRGLKFIPPTQPSLVFFALGLEFTLLITYAITLMFGRTDEEQQEQLASSQPNDKGGDLLLTQDFENSREVEKLLKVFIKSSKKR